MTDVLAAIGPAATTAGSMRERVAEFDWGSTPIGPRETWPVELRLAVGQILDSSFPKAIVWGPSLTTIYNDGFVPILGDKHPALGQSFADIWAEAWDEICDIAARAYAGEPTYIEDFPLVIDRNGYSEQTWFTFATARCAWPTAQSAECSILLSKPQERCGHRPSSHSSTRS